MGRLPSGGGSTAVRRPLHRGGALCSGAIPLFPGAARESEPHGCTVPCRPPGLRTRGLRRLSRGPFGHGGASPTLEDWLDAARLTGSATRKPAPGHKYGLHLTSRDKSALIAFL